MEVLVFLVPLALTLGALGLAGFSGRSRTASTTTSKARAGARSPMTSPLLKILPGPPWTGHTSAIGIHYPRS